MKKTTIRILIWASVAVLSVLVLAAVLVPSYVKARNTSACNACINNLRQIDGGKEQAAIAQGWTPETDCDTETNRVIVNQYIKGNRSPMCPDGGTYRYGRLNENPTCSLYVRGDKKTYGHHFNFGKE